MTVKEFKKWVKDNKVPDCADIFIWADHGQNGELGSSCVVSKSDTIDGWDTMVWEYDNYEECYDEDVVDEYPKNGYVTAITIFGD